MNEYVVLGDASTAELVREACRKHNLLTLDAGELELQDEFDCRRWFSRNIPKGVFLCLGLGAQLNVNSWMLNVAGTLNVIRAALGFSDRLILAAHFPSNEFFLFTQLIHMLQREKQVDFYALSGNPKESLQAFSERCVLSMADVSSQKTKEGSPESSQQGREVRDQVLPESQGSEQHRSLAQPVLEVPIAAAEGEAPGNVCPQCASAEGQEARDSNITDPRSVPGVV